MKVYNPAFRTSCYSKTITEVVKKKLKSIKKLIKNSVKWQRRQEWSSLQMLFHFLSRWEKLRWTVQGANFSDASLCPTVGSVITMFASESRRCIFVSACSCFYLFLYLLESVFDFILLWFLIGLQLLINHVKFWQNLILRVIEPPPPPNAGDTISCLLNCYSH